MPTLLRWILMLGLLVALAGLGFFCGTEWPGESPSQVELLGEALGDEAGAEKARRHVRFLPQVDPSEPSSAAAPTSKLGLAVRSTRPDIFRILEFQVQSLDDDGRVVAEGAFSGQFVNFESRVAAPLLTGARLRISAEGFVDREVSVTEVIVADPGIVEVRLTPEPNLTVELETADYSGGFLIHCVQSWRQPSSRSGGAVSRTTSNGESHKVVDKRVTCRLGKPVTFGLLVRPGAMIGLVQSQAKTKPGHYIFERPSLSIKPLVQGERRHVRWALFGGLWHFKLTGIPHGESAHRKVFAEWSRGGSGAHGYGMTDENGEFVVGCKDGSLIECWLLPSADKSDRVRLVSDPRSAIEPENRAGTHELRPERPMVVVQLKEEDSTVNKENYSLSSASHSGTIFQPRGRSLLAVEGLESKRLYLYQGKTLVPVQRAALVELSSEFYELELSPRRLLRVIAKNAPADTSMNIDGCLVQMGERPGVDSWVSYRKRSGKQLEWKFEDIPEGDWEFAVRIRLGSMHAIQRRLTAFGSMPSEILLRTAISPSDSAGVLSATVTLPHIDFRKIRFEGLGDLHEAAPRSGTLNGEPFVITPRHEAVVRSWDPQGKMTVGPNIEIDMSASLKIESDGTIVIDVATKALTRNSFVVSSSQCEVKAIGLLTRAFSGHRITDPKQPLSGWENYSGNRATFMSTELSHSAAKNSPVFLWVETSKGQLMLGLERSRLSSSLSINLDDFGTFEQIVEESGKRPKSFLYSIPFGGRTYQFAARIGKKGRHYWQPFAPITVEIE
ncbi:MAG: hypothetical protein V3W41_19165 [Planctomycetota bacterium]